MSKKPLVRKPLTVRHHKYIEGVLAGKSGRQAAIEAGFSPASASSRSLELNKHPEVVKALEAGKAQMRKATGYDVEAAFSELDKTIEAAAKVNQFSAVVKAIEAKSRMVGILDKPSPLLGININEVLEKARARLDRFHTQQLAEVQDASVIEANAARALAIANADIFG